MSYLALGSFAIWLIVLFAFAPSAYRYIRGRYNLIDSYRTGFFFFGFIWVGGMGRLIFFPEAEEIRTVILALSIGVAVYLLVLARQGAVR